MKNITIAAIIFATSLVSSTAFAQDSEVTAIDTQVQALEEQIKQLRGKTVLEAMEEVCSLSSVILTERASAACAGDPEAMPQLISDGSRFSSRGVGSEFNTLIANIDVFRAAE